MTSLSLLASYDELIRRTNTLINNPCEEAFLKFVMNQEEMRQKWLASEQECQRLHAALNKSQQEYAALESKMYHARRKLEEEHHKRRAAEEQRALLEGQIDTARRVLFNDGGKNINDETREKLQFLNNTTLTRQSNMHNFNHQSNIHVPDIHIDKLNTIVELDRTGSLLSECISKSEDDWENDMVMENQKTREWKAHRPSAEFSVLPPKQQRRSAGLHKVAELNTSDRIVATTTVVVPKEGTITASSTIETVPGNDDVQTPQRHSRKRRKSSGEHNRSKLSHVDKKEPPIDTAPSAPKADMLSSSSDTEETFKPSPNIGGYTLNKKMSRNHNFTEKICMKRETCIPCGKRIPFPQTAYKCRECRAIAHEKCKDLLSLPCVPAGNTPTLRGVPGTIADYTPAISPMVPSIVVHCVSEIELRGMNEQGLYRVNGTATEAKILKEKFLKGKGAPNLSNIDIPTICSTLKDFLRSLREPLIGMAVAADLSRATTMTDKQDADAIIYQAISEMPRPNRDTLAYLMLHLQRVSSSPECRMPISNLAKIFGPTLVAYSSQEPSITMLNETRIQVAIVEALLQIPSDYWDNYANPSNTNTNTNCTPRTGELKHTPSQESLIKRSISRGFFTPLSGSSFARRNKKYFATPPSKQGF